MKTTKLHFKSVIIIMFVLSAGIQSFGQTSKSKFSHRMPESDSRYRSTKSYIETVPWPEYTWASDSAYEAFLDMKYGVRIHWGVYAKKNMPRPSWLFLPMTLEEKQAYQEMYKTWNPQKFSADEWMDLFLECEMKMFAFTAKHHDGFSMFDTKTRVKSRANYLAPGGPALEECDLAYSIMETPFKRDVVKELTDAAHKKGLKIDLYFSHPDWYDADFRPHMNHPLQTPSSPGYEQRNEPKDPEEVRRDRFQGNGPYYVSEPTEEEVNRMMMRHRNQLKELLTNYGKIDMVCLDTRLNPNVWPMLRQTLIELRKIQPDVMFRARGIGNYGDYYTPEGVVPGGKEQSDVPWFVIYPLGYSSAYDSVGSRYKGAKWIVNNVIDCAAKGGNFMVGIGPDCDGQFHPTAIAQLKQTGLWLKTNGEGIFATRAREDSLYKEGDNIRFTRTKDYKTIYVHCFEWPGEKLVLKTVKPQNGSKIYMFGNSAPLNWELNNDGELVIDTPETLKNSVPENIRLAYSFKIDI